MGTPFYKCPQQADWKFSVAKQRQPDTTRNHQLRKRYYQSNKNLGFCQVLTVVTQNIIRFITTPLRIKFNNYGESQEVDNY